jgi:hypothetical protein
MTTKVVFGLSPSYFFGRGKIYTENNNGPAQSTTRELELI